MQVVANLFQRTQEDLSVEREFSECMKEIQKHSQKDVSDFLLMKEKQSGAAARSIRSQSAGPPATRK